MKVMFYPAYQVLRDTAYYQRLYQEATERMLSEGHTVAEETLEDMFDYYPDLRDKMDEYDREMLDLDEGHGYDLVTETGQFVSDVPFAEPSTDFARPREKVIRVAGMRMTVYYYHDGTPIDVKCE